MSERLYSKEAPLALTSTFPLSFSLSLSLSLLRLKEDGVWFRYLSEGSSLEMRWMGSADGDVDDGVDSGGSGGGEGLTEW